MAAAQGILRTDPELIPCGRNKPFDHLLTHRVKKLRGLKCRIAKKVKIAPTSVRNSRQRFI